MSKDDPGPKGSPHDEPDFPRLLRGVGLKLTKTRLGLLRLVARENRHLTADEITNGLHADGIKLDRVTVYRNIDRMLDAGLFVASFLPGRALRVGLCRHPDAPHHHHIVCRNCGRMAETVGCLLSDRWDLLREEMRTQTGFDLTGHVMQYVGLCPQCSAPGGRLPDGTHKS